MHIHEVHSVLIVIFKIYIHEVHSALIVDSLIVMVQRVVIVYLQNSHTSCMQCEVIEHTSHCCSFHERSWEYRHGWWIKEKTRYWSSLRISRWWWWSKPPLVDILIHVDNRDLSILNYTNSLWPVKSNYQQWAQNALHVCELWW